MDTQPNTKPRRTAKRPAQPAAAGLDVSKSGIEHVLANFQVIRGKRLLQVFNLLPGAVLIATIMFMFAVWYTRGTIQLSFATAGLAVILCVLVIRVLYARFPRTLLVIWHRKLLQPKGGARPDPSASVEQQVAAQFTQFVQASEEQLNNRSSSVFGLVITLLVVWIFWPFKALSPQAWLASLQGDWFSTSVTIVLFVIYYAAAFVSGLILWRVIVIARRISRLGVEFDFNLQVEHPDGCGGFRPIGDICLTLAYVLAPLLLAIGGWLVAINVVSPAFLDRYMYISTTSLPLVISQLQVLTVLMVALSLLGFLQPLASIHEAMSASKTRLQDELDRISEEIHETSIQLRTNAERLTAEQGVSLEQKIDFLRRVYNRNVRIPTWPINYEHLGGLLSIQIAPTIGIITSVIGLVNGLGGVLR